MKLLISKRELSDKKKKATRVAPGSKAQPKMSKKQFNDFAKKAFNPRFKEIQDIANFFRKRPENRWGIYKGVVSANGETQDNEKTQFECYCCGWLQYYDEIVRKECTDHSIWFDWNGTGCTIYLDPRPRNLKDAKSSLPGSFSSDPTNPTAPPPPYS
jgi:hypothetical protein